MTTGFEFLLTACRPTSLADCRLEPVCTIVSGIHNSCYSSLPPLSNSHDKLPCTHLLPLPTHHATPHIDTTHQPPPPSLSTSPPPPQHPIPHSRADKPPPPAPPHHPHQSMEQHTSQQHRAEAYAASRTRTAGRIELGWGRRGGMGGWEGWEDGRMGGWEWTDCRAKTGMEWEDGWGG